MGQEVVVYTDHLNLLYQKTANNRMMRWRSMLEEYIPTFKHIKGKSNKVADALSRLDMQPNEYDTINNDPTPKTLKYNNNVSKSKKQSYIGRKDIMEETFTMSPQERL